jgi:DNA polymerase-3 subunit epsilon
MRPLPTFHPQSTDLLDNVVLARRFQQAVEDGVLIEDWEKFCRWLKLELRELAPSLRDWPAPSIYPHEEAWSVNIEADASWTHNGDHVVCLYFEVWPNTLYANVGLWVSEEWPHREAFCSFIARHRPEGFTDCDDGAPVIGYPFWKDLPLAQFQANGVFDMESFVRAIGESFESLAPIRNAIGEFLAGPKVLEPVVAPVGKALILDLEAMDEVVEVGLILVAYNPQTCEVAGVLDSYTGLRDPGAGTKLPPKFEPKMVRGKKLDRGRIEDLIAQADVIISHNNAFDRPRFERLFPTGKSVHWLCSLYDLPWSDAGFGEKGLEYLCKSHGIRNRDAHRALPDAEALLHVLVQKHGSLSYFAELLHSEGQPKVKAQAVAAGKRSK